MNKSEAKKALEDYPHHPDVQKYGYVMMWDKGRNKWIAGYEGETTVWYFWDRKQFVNIGGLGSPFKGDTVDYKKVCALANEA
jgi:hypothetical protein